MKGLKALRTLGDFVRWEHSIFALPFVYMGAMLAAGGIPGLRVIVLVTVAAVAARTSALAINRIVDRQLDALNPRTQDRPLVTGAVTLPQAAGLAVVSTLVLMAAAAGLNRLALYLSPIPVLAFVVYPYTKRFTWACHGFLGLAQAFGPMGGWIAVRGRLDLPGVVLGVAVGLWIGGFDLLYALMDIDFDREHGVFSFPARFGVPATLALARLTHVVVLLMLASLYLWLPLGLFYAVGLAGTAYLMWSEHRLVSPGDLSRVNRAFFDMNGWISVVMFAGTLLGVIWS